jgi:hypothetical protein
VFFAENQAPAGKKPEKCPPLYALCNCEYRRCVEKTVWYLIGRAFIPCSKRSHIECPLRFFLISTLAVRGSLNEGE